MLARVGSAVKRKVYVQKFETAKRDNMFSKTFESIYQLNQD